jgi:alkylation response protein AidB-like acyl-CoA dehydrogenase
MATPPVLKFGTEAQKQRYLVPAIKGEKILSLAITEPNAGSDVAAIDTVARRATASSSTAERCSSPMERGPMRACW